MWSFCWIINSNTILTTNWKFSFFFIHVDSNRDFNSKDMLIFLSDYPKITNINKCGFLALQVNQLI